MKMVYWGPRDHAHVGVPFTLLVKVRWMTPGILEASLSTILPLALIRVVILCL